MGIKFDTYEEYNPETTKKITNTTFITGRSPLEVFNNIVNQLGIDEITLQEHPTNYIDAKGNDVVRYEIVIKPQYRTINTYITPLDLLKEGYTLSSEELYDIQSDPFNKEDLCGYTK